MGLRRSRIAISCASHSGSTVHAREAFKLLWQAELEVGLLQCPVPHGAERAPTQLSWKHAAFLATKCKMGWPLETYLQLDHPLQQEVNRRVAELLGLPP